MPSDNHELSRQELYKAGKLEERRSNRAPLVVETKTELPLEKEIESSKMRPELIAIGILVLVMIILTLVGM
jgi:hypothetical protein